MRNAGKYALRVLVMLAPLELAAFFGARLLEERELLYRPPVSEGHEVSEAYGEYLEVRDPLLGWPSPGRLGGERLDERGARRARGGPDGPACGAVFGDSFTYGDEVEAEDTWAHRLGVRLGCRVANYGVWAFGTDQALLRFEHRFDEPAEVVVLAHYSDDIQRNVNRYRGFMSRGGFGWKPRFVLADDGALTLVPMAEVPPEEVAQFGVRKFGVRGGPLADEWFAPGGPAGTIASGFPYLATLARLPFHFRVRAAIAGFPSWQPFYEPDHPSGALPLTVAILERFVREAEAQGRVPVVMVIPDQMDLRAAQAGDGLSVAPLLAALDAGGPARPRLPEGLLAELDGEDPCALFLRCDGGHMSPAGHEAIARVLERWLRARGLPRRAAPQDGPA